MRISESTLGRPILAIALVASAAVSAQPLGPAEEALHVEAAWASARLGGTSRTMISRDYLQVSPSGIVSGSTDVQDAPAPRHWEDDCVGWTYGRAAVVRCTEDDVLPDQSGSRPKTLALRVFVKEGVDWMAVLNHTVWLRPSTSRVAAPPAAGPGPARSTDEAQDASETGVLGVQRAIQRAMTARDTTVFATHTASEFVRIDTDGQVQYRDAVIERVARARESRASIEDEMRVRVYPRLAVLSWKEVPVNREGRTGRPLRTTRAFARINGTWQQVVEMSSAAADVQPVSDQP